jgi:hypothetical protein
MARSPFTLAAAVAAALPSAVATGVRTLTSAGDGRFDSAVVSLASGEEVSIRVANDDVAAQELAAEAVALRALTPGARTLLPFLAPAYLGATMVDDARALVTYFMPGYQVDAGDVPAGPGLAPAMGQALAALHALPAHVIHDSGLPVRSAVESREELRAIVDRAAATGRVPARLIVRWRNAAEDDELWRFESRVNLGGAQATSFIISDDVEGTPTVGAMISWHGLCIADPAADLAWLSRAPQAGADVFQAYQAASPRGSDPAILLRARLRAELEFARWLLHGQDLHREDILEEATELLDALAESIREDDLAFISERDDDYAEAVESAFGAARRIPTSELLRADTSMQTDNYSSESLWIPIESPGDNSEPDPDVADTVAETAQSPESISGEDPESEAERAARAALQRWRKLSSE